MDTIKMERWTEGGTRKADGKGRASRGEWRLERESSFQVLLKGKEKNDFIY